MPTYYETKQAILEDAGFSNVTRGEIASGLANGSNATFSTQYGPFADTNYDDVVDVNDVIAYVNGSPAAVSSINVAAHSFTLAVAPANGSTVTVDYRYSPITDLTVTKVRDEAQDLIDTAMAGTDPTPYATVPPTVRKMTRVYAAGMLLAKDYGFNSDTEKTSKDGFMKMALVEGTPSRPGWLEKYRLAGGASGLSSETESAEIITEPVLFSQYDQTAGRYSPDREFMNGLGFETRGDVL